MKILQVIPYFCFGGAETMCENLTYALRDLGHDVMVVSLYDDQTPIACRMEAAGIRIRYLDKKLGLDLSMVPKLITIMKQERPDVVHTHLDVIKYAAMAAKLSGVSRSVHTVHSVAHKEAEGILQKIINQANITLLIQQGITINTQDMPSESIKMATAVVATGPIILVYPFVQKYFVSGMTVGAVEG